MLLEIQTFLHPVNFILISGIIQCLIVAGILIFYRKGHKPANRFFGLFIIISCLHFSWPLIMDVNLEGIFLQVLWIPYSYILALGPLLLFYTRSLTENNFKVRPKALIHFLPALVEVFAHIYFIKESIEFREPTYNISGFLAVSVYSHPF